MKYSFTEYLNEEIPILKGKRGFRWLWALIIARYCNPSYDAIFLLRYCYVNFQSTGLKKFLRIIYKRKLVKNYGIYFNVGNNSEIGLGLVLPHPSSIVFGNGINIGECCTIYQNVTFGAKKVGCCKQKGSAYPQIGNNCIFYAGAVVLGPINISDGTQVGANSVLITDTEKNSIYAGVPAVKKIKACD